MVLHYEEELAGYEWELKTNYGETESNRLLGKTPAIQNYIAEYDTQHQVYLYAEAMRGEYSPKDAADRVLVARAYNVAPSLLFKNHELYDHLASKVQMDASIGDSIWRGYKQYAVGREMSKLGASQIAFGADERKRARLAELERELASYAPPIREKWYHATFREGASLGHQMGSYAADIAREPDNALAALGGAGLAYLTGGASVIPMLTGAYKASSLYGMMKGYAGMAYNEYSQIEGVSDGQARLAGLLTGVGTGAVMYAVPFAIGKAGKSLMKLGGVPISQAAPTSAEIAKKIFSIPGGGEILLTGGKATADRLVQGGLGNMYQELVVMGVGEGLRWVNDQPNTSWEDLGKRAWGAFAVMVEADALFAGMSLLLGGGRSYLRARQIQKAVNMLADTMGISPAQALENARGEFTARQDLADAYASTLEADRRSQTETTEAG
ncbi:MAG: hypothetical protein LBD04_04115, partial [Synergistaceae bacterium]|nr:hypothetical protein [Synergistaceae bacterium]